MLSPLQEKREDVGFRKEHEFFAEKSFNQENTNWLTVKEDTNENGLLNYGLDNAYLGGI